MPDLVSIVMPAYNVAPFIHEAVATVRAQTWPEIELVVVDDGSRDGTTEILERLSRDWTEPGRRMIVVRQANRGAAAARNAGLERASGAYIGLFDADDRCDPNLIERLVAALCADPGLDMAFPLYRYIDAEGHVTGVEPPPLRKRLGAVDLMLAMFVHSPLFRAEAVARTGPVDETLSACIDLDYYARMVAGRGRAIAVVPEPMADYRKRAGQITSDWRRMRANWERVLDKMAAAGHGLTRDQERRARARNLIYWATLAYQADDYPATRRLVAESWRLAPGAALGNPLARIRTLAALASLLPRPLHAALRRRTRRPSDW